MHPEFAIDVIKSMMLTAVTLVSPLLLAAMAIGLMISVFQAVTSIQEQTLTFFPKAIGVAMLVVLLLPWLLRTMMDFTIALIQRMPQMVN